MFEFLKRRARAKQHRIELSRLNAHQLRDIGLLPKDAATLPGDTLGRRRVTDW